MQFCDAVQSVIDTYKTQYAEVVFQPDRYASVFGDQAEVPDAGWSIAEMSDNEVLQIALLDFISRLVKAEEVIEVQHKAISTQPNRATRRKK